MEEDDWLTRSCPIHLDDVISPLTRLSNRAIPLRAVDRRRSGALSSDPIRLLLTLSLTVTVRTTSCFHGCCFSLLLRLVKANPISPPAISFTPDFG